MAFSRSALLVLAAYTTGVLSQAAFDWDCTNSLGTCNNACYAIVCDNYPSTLTYDSDPTNRDPRRTASGCNQNPCNSGISYASFGTSCDEFPFASVQEGGTSAILRCVDPSENSSEGGQLGNFYKTINDGDQFDLFIANYGGSQYCSPNPDCTNDGGEFVLSGGAFVNAKDRKRMIGSFHDAPSTRKASAPALRQFMGEDGVVRAMLSNNPQSNPIGRTVWSETKGHVKIVSEIKN